MNRGGYSLHARLVGATLLVSLLGLLGSAAFYYAEVEGIGEDLRNRTLQSQIRELGAALRTSASGEVRFELPPAWAQAYSKADSGFEYSLYRGRDLVASSPNARTPLPLPDDALLGRLYFRGVAPERAVLLAQRASDNYTLVVGHARAEEEVLVDSLLGENFEHIAVVLAPLALSTALLIWLVVRWSLKPLRRAAVEAAAIGPVNPSARIGTQDIPSEIRPLVDAANGALERFASAYAAERRFTADAAHELRTPLAVLALRLQEARLDGQTDWAGIEQDMTQLRRLVTQLLDLARKESGNLEEAHRAQGEVNLARLARESGALLLPLAEESGRDMQVNAPDSALVRGNADDLRDMVRNLIENALVHGRGTVRIDVENGDEVAVEVCDDGPGVPAALRQDVFRRFYKGSSTSPGAGLGLAIVAQVARSHGGHASVVPGPSSCFRVTLPRAHPEEKPGRGGSTSAIHDRI